MNPYALIDLHLHLDGSLSLESVRELAAMQNMEVERNDRALLTRLQVNPDCRDLNEYLEKFAFPCSLLQTAEALTKCVSNLRRELAQQGLLYAEIRFAPQLHTLCGLTQAQVVQAAVKGLEVHPFRANLILCCMRGDGNHRENLETVEITPRFLGKGVCAVDLAGAEALFPTENFRELFKLVEEKNIPCTIHAGEACGPESVWKALEFGARRIGHGVRSLENPDLVRHLAERGVTLELCPTSNLNTCIFEKIGDYPLLQLMEAGVAVTVNTDNMTVSGTTLREEYRALRRLGLTTQQLETLACNAADAAFVTPAQAKQLKAEIAHRFTTWLNG